MSSDRPGKARSPELSEQAAGDPLITRFPAPSEAVDINAKLIIKNRKLVLAKARKAC